MTENTRAAAARAVPVSTYRLQFNSGFTFEQAATAVPYLAALGITHVYASPFFMARPGSTHGYDVCDHNRINPELGGEDAFETFVDCLHAHGLGQMVDFVPNHMGLDPQRNAWWHDVLENGICSEYARYFDIDWDPITPALRNHILLAILGNQYGQVLENGELQLAYDEGRLVVDYHGTRLPINPRQVPRVFRIGLDALRKHLTDEDERLREFLSILTSLHNLPIYTETDPARIEERRREKEVARGRLVRLVSASPSIAEHIANAIRVANGVPGAPETFDVLHEVLEGQPYRLSYWKTAPHEINYRRFFDVNELGAVRMEDPEVFGSTHRLLAELLRRGAVDAVRIDHADGLYDPEQYFTDLQTLGRQNRPLAGAVPFYLVAEKILSRGERLPGGWDISGTTGYEFLNDLNGLFVDPHAARALVRVWQQVTGRTQDVDDIVYTTKKLIMETSMASELNVMAHELSRIAQQNRKTRDFTLYSLRDALSEVVACLHVYRTYVRHTGWRDSDRRTIDAAVREARRRNPAFEATMFDFVKDVMLPHMTTGAEAETDGAERHPALPLPQLDPGEYERRLTLAMKLQQYTGPVQAKGLEDTAFYRYNVLVSLNEVGGEPAHIGRTPEEFHHLVHTRRLQTPRTMLTTATHDTKLGEDVRARINVISEIVDHWRRAVTRWMRMNAPFRTALERGIAPDPNDEYRFYQVLLGCWPPAPADESRLPAGLVERLQQYMLKSIREAKTHTSWLHANEAYEQGVSRFVESVLAGVGARRFLPAFRDIRERVALPGLLNSLAQLTAKLGGPGVSDVYQGTELWDFNLVDPDNRRPVDFALRTRVLDGIEPVLPRLPGVSSDASRDGQGEASLEALHDLVRNWTDGRVKLWITAQGLRARRAWPSVFLEGDYAPLATESAVHAGVVAFARHHDGHAIVVVVPRLASALCRATSPRVPVGDDWGASRVLLPTSLASAELLNVFSGARLRVVQDGGPPRLDVAEIFRDLPAAMLVTTAR